MYILIAADGELSLQDSDNMRAFSIREAEVKISGRGDDPQWVKNFWDMSTKVEAYGNSDMTKNRVKAHLDQI